MSIQYDGSPTWKSTLIIPEGSDTHIYTGYIDVLFQDLADRSTHLRQLVDSDADGIADFLRSHIIECTSGETVALTVKPPAGASGTVEAIEIRNENDIAVAAWQTSGVLQFAARSNIKNFMSKSGIEFNGDASWEYYAPVGGSSFRNDTTDVHINCAYDPPYHKIKLAKLHIFARKDITEASLSVGVRSSDLASWTEQAAIPTTELLATTTIPINTLGKFLDLTVDIASEISAGDQLIVYLTINNHDTAYAVKVAFIVFEYYILEI